MVGAASTARDLRKMNRLVRIGVRVGYGVALLAPAALVLGFILRYGVNVPYWDQWELIGPLGPLTRFQNGTLGWAEIFRQHNEHRMVFPKLVMLALASLTRWNIVAEMLLSLLLAVASLAVLMALARPSLRKAGPAVRLWATFTIAAMMFSLAQWDSWLCGWQIQWFLSVLAALSSIALATWSLESARPYAYITGAAAAAVVSQFSLASGAAVWICGALILAFHRLRRGLILPLWLAAAVASSAVFLIGYRQQTQHPSLLFAVEYPLSFLLYLGNYLSGPLGRHAAVGMAVGVAFIFLAVVVVTRHRRDPALFLPWIAIGVFVGANAILTGIARVGSGTEQALESRYVTIALLLPVASVPMAVLAFRAWPARVQAHNRSTAGFVGAAILTIMVIAGDVRGVSGFAALSQRLTVGRDCLLVVEKAKDECLRILHPDPAVVRERALELQTFGWSSFASKRARGAGTVQLSGADGVHTWRLWPGNERTGPIGPGYIDSARLDDGVLTTMGWAHHPAGNDGEPPRRVLVTTDGTIIGEAAVVGERPDVAAHFSDPALRRSGWTLRTRPVPEVARPYRLKAYLVLTEGILTPLGGEAVAGETR